MSEHTDDLGLLPCPFCGGDPEMSYYAKGANPAAAGHYVECSQCSAGGEPFDIQGEMPDRVEYTKSKAIAAWNTRHAHPLPGDALREASAAALRCLEISVQSFPDVERKLRAALTQEQARA